MKIGFFDSGIGGLTILTAVERELPLYEYVYYGDTKNVPYGNKTEAEVYALTQSAVSWLFEKGALLVIIACNTASAETLRKLQDDFLKNNYPDRKILGVIIPTIEELSGRGSRKALLIGTKRTVESQKYYFEIGKRQELSHIELTSVSTPGLVPLIESGNMRAVYRELDLLMETRRGEMDTIVLGCTHYTVCKEYLRTRYPELVHVISQDEIIPKKLREYLNRHSEIESRLGRRGTKTIYLTKPHEPQRGHLCCREAYKYK